MLEDRSVNVQVVDAEIKMAAFLCEHNLPFRIMDHFSDLLPELCPDSKIAHKFKCKQTKATCIVTNVLAPYFHDDLVLKLKALHFSVIIDETTDVSTRKELAVAVRFYEEERVKCVLYEMLEVTEGNAEALFGALERSFERDGIPLQNIIGFASDTTNVMFGEHNSVVSRLKEKIPEIFTMRCICHSAHLCASYACEKLPRTAEELIRDVYNYFSHSAKRQGAFQSFQAFAEVEEPHKLLRPCQTRWLSLHSCVSRLIEQWDTLLAFFISSIESDNLLITQRIVSYMQNPVWKLYYYFLDFALEKFTALNVMFQSSKSSIHCLYSSLQTIYKDFLSCWQHTALKDINPASQLNFLPLTAMYMGTYEAEDRQRAPDVQHFLKKVQEFYIESAIQIKKRFPIGDNILEMLQVLDPNVSYTKFPSLIPLAIRFPNLMPEGKLQQLDNHWRNLRLVTLPFNKEDMDPEVFWGRLSTIINGVGTLQFDILCNFMKSLMCLPHSNADVERVS